MLVKGRLGNVLRTGGRAQLGGFRETGQATELTQVTVVAWSRVVALGGWVGSRPERVC